MTERSICGLTLLRECKAMKKLSPDTERKYVIPKEIGRNDPCPCGSGLKVKKCHRDAFGRI
jgi:preprotein translocase subunit SecA